VSSGFQFDGGAYAVPLVYSVSLRGKLAAEPPDAGADAAADDEDPLLDDEPPLVQAVAVPSASTARTA